MLSPQQDVRTFGTTAGELLALRDWLEGQRITHVAMESTGVYWKPVFYVLEEAMTCVLEPGAHAAGAGPEESIERLFVLVVGRR